MLLIYMETRLIPIFILLLFGISMAPILYCKELRTSSVEISYQISLQELNTIFKNIIIPDLLTNPQVVKPLSYEKVEFKSVESATEDSRFVITFEPSKLKLPLFYVLHKKIWRINNSTLTIFYGRCNLEIGSQDSYYVNWCFALSDESKIYHLSGFDTCDFQSLVNDVAPTGMSLDLFYDLCIFYLSNVYERGCGTYIIQSFDDIPHKKPGSPGAEIYWIMIKKESDEKLHPLRLEQSEKGFHLSIITLKTYIYHYNRSIDEWDFYMDTQNKWEIKERHLFSIDDLMT